MSDTASVEAALIAVIEALRHEYDAALKTRGLGMEPPKVSVIRPEPGCYTSEIRIDIIRLDTCQLADRLEFFAFEDGKSQLTEEELQVWLVEQI